MNRSSLKSRPFIGALFAVAGGAFFGNKPEPDELEAQRRSAADVLAFIAPARSGNSGCRRIPAAVRRDRRKLKLKNRLRALRAAA